MHRKQMDDALRESEQRYRVFIAKNADAMWRIEFETPIPTDLPEDEQIEHIYRSGYLAECNDALARLLGYEKAEQLLGATFAQLAQRADSHLREDVRSAIRAGYRFTTVETQPVDLAGKRRSLLRSQWGIVENGMLRRIWGTHRDLTDLRRAETAAQVSEGRLAELLEGAHLVTVMLDANGAITFCNEYLLSLAGWREEEVTGKNWFELAVPPQERERVRAEFATTQVNAPAPHYFESTLVGIDGQRRLIGWKTTALRDFDGRVSGIAGVGRDLTAYRMLEAGVQQAQKLDHIGRTVGRIAEDFHSVLTKIAAHCTSLLPAGQSSSSPALVEIKAEADRGSDLVQQLLAFGRRQQLRPLLLNVNTLAEECGRTLGQLLPVNVALTLDLDPSVGFVRADAGQLQQALLNLALNARDAMPNGGTLTIASANVKLDQNRALPLAKIDPGEYVRLSVRDTGGGISEDAQAHLFEPFYTTKEHRAGLGLAAVYGIIQQSGGHIVVETELRAGTTIQIYLPRVRPQL
jgi:PAS domain S-box-containing protein